MDLDCFIVVDMRWGVRDEATGESLILFHLKIDFDIENDCQLKLFSDDHMTTDLCMKEIENCQRLSMGPNFVAFLGQK